MCHEGPGGGTHNHGYPAQPKRALHEALQTGHDPDGLTARNVALNLFVHRIARAMRPGHPDGEIRGDLAWPGHGPRRCSRSPRPNGPPPSCDSDPLSLVSARSVPTGCNRSHSFAPWLLNPPPVSASTSSFSSSSSSSSSSCSQAWPDCSQYFESHQAMGELASDDRRSRRVAGRSLWLPLPSERRPRAPTPRLMYPTVAFQTASRDAAAVREA